MKTLCGCWENFLGYSLSRSQLAIVFCVFTAQAFWLARCHQIFGSLPFSYDVNVFGFYWQLPFPVSRVWDLLLGPLYLLISEAIFQCGCLMEEDDMYHYWEKIPGTLNGFGTTLFLSVTVGFLGASACGAAYFIPVSILAMVTLFVSGLLLAICASFRNRL